ncbi:unnamed protein product [Symbiodinium natans]|uniref:Uncharacterized protein n=1 Tax=Symbiodinium natans TaxID=878477 RepID=A0A812NSU8_9DINO|nr:unnamed protein product [Symbiodinium natans]
MLLETQQLQQPECKDSKALLAAEPRMILRIGPARASGFAARLANTVRQAAAQRNAPQPTTATWRAAQQASGHSGLVKRGLGGELQSALTSSMGKGCQARGGELPQLPQLPQTPNFSSALRSLRSLRD